MKKLIVLSIAGAFFLTPVFIPAAAFAGPEQKQQASKKEYTPSRKEIEDRVKHSPRYTVPRINKKGSYAQCK